jgi:quercetin dioxygenase-like cupin family protein
MNQSENGEVRVIPIEVNRDVEEVVIEDIADLTGTRGLRVSVVTFPPGSRRPWSSHDQDQYIWPLSGRGVLITQRGEVAIEAGSLVYLPVGVKHQHGAAEGSGFTQLSVIGGERKGEPEEG